MATTDSPRIVIDARCLRGAPGGVATYTTALVDRLPRLLPEVPFVLLRHSTMPGPISRAPNVIEWPLGGDPNDPISYFIRGPSLAHRFGLDDLFHAPYRILPLGAPQHSVITMHDAMQVVCPELVFPTPWQRPILQRYWSFAVGSSLRRAGRILAVSRHSAQDTTRVEPQAEERIRVTVLGVDTIFRPMSVEQAVEKSKEVMPAGRRFFLVLGGGYANKNHAAAVVAFARAFRSSDDVHLLIVQRERTLPAELGLVLDRSGLRDRVTVRGGISTETLVALYARALGFVFPSLYEGFGLPVLEAMASGCPVIASSLTSVPEVAGDAALLCDPRDETTLGERMRQVANDEELRQELIRKGMTRAAGFSWDTTARETILAYREIAPWIPMPVACA